MFQSGHFCCVRLLSRHWIRPAMIGLLGIAVFLSGPGWFGAARAVSASEQRAFAPTVVEGHKLPQAGEHPRLMFRGEQAIDDLRRAAATEAGRRITERMQQAQRVSDALPLTGQNRAVLKEAGYKAAGAAALYWLTGDRRQLADARESAIEELVEFPMASTLFLGDRISRLQGLALAYDFAFAGWDEATRKRVRDFLLQEAEVIRGLVRQARQPERVMGFAAAGMVEMVLLAGADDRGALERIALSEREVVGFLESSIGEKGFAGEGESVRQAAMSSGVLPFMQALKLVMGRDYSDHDGLREVMTPMVYLAVPGVGIPVMGRATAAFDRGGFFAHALPWVSSERRPQVRWLFDQLDGDRFLGVIRAHEGIAVLLSGMVERVEPVAPAGDIWPRAFADPKSQMAVVRSGWQNSEDVLAVAHDGAIRLLGLGEYWISQAGQHAGQWSHSRTLGRQENMFTFETEIDRSEAYRLRSSAKLRSAEWFDDQTGGLMIYDISGRMERVSAFLEFQVRDENNRRVTQRVEVPDVGAFGIERQVAVRMIPDGPIAAIMVVADEVEGAEGIMRHWVLHVGAGVTMTTDEKGFVLQGETSELRGTVVYPRGGEFSIQSSDRNPHLAHFLSIATESDRIEVVMTLSRQRTPRPDTPDNGLRDGVRVGDQIITFQEGRIQFRSAE